MDKLIKIQYLECALDVFVEFFNHYSEDKIHAQIVYQSDTDVFTGNFLQYSDSQNIQFKTLTHDNYVLAESVSVNNSNSTEPYVKIRHTLGRDMQNTGTQRLKDILESPELLLEYLLKFVSDLGSDTNFHTDTIHNYKSLKFNYELPFVTIDGFNGITPISIIVTELEQI